EDGIRDFHVTGVQTCALPISSIVLAHRSQEQGIWPPRRLHGKPNPTLPFVIPSDSEGSLVTTLRRSPRAVVFSQRSLAIARDDKIGRASCRERVEIPGVAVER